MFKNKRILLVALLFGIFTFTACSKKEISEVLENAKNVNNTVNSYYLVNGISNESTGKLKTQLMKAQIFVDPISKNVSKGIAEIDYNGPSNEAENSYIAKMVDGVEDTSEKTNVTYSINPDYFKLLKGIYAFNQNDFELEEKDDEYRIKFKDGANSSDLYKLLETEYKLKLDKVTPNEVKFSFEAVFIKDSYYLKRIHWTADYSGTKGLVKIESTTSYSDWNSVNLEK
mgnify:CR=1 FL=1